MFLGGGYMSKNKGKFIIIAVVILIGCIVAFNVISNIIRDNIFLNTRNSYEEIVNGITIDNIVNDTYITSLSVETDFEMKKEYDEYDTQYDMVNIYINLSSDFESMDIKDRVSVLKKVEEEVIAILTNGKDSTGYSEIIAEEYASYKDSNVRVIEELDICFTSSSKNYKFYNGSYHSYNSISIQGEDGKFGYTEYNVEWNGDTVVSVKEQDHSSNSYTPPAEDYNSLTYREVTDDDTLGEVWAMTQSFVRDKLKSPKSADFPTYGDSKVSITNSGSYYKVTGYVDAENSFGAEIRTTFLLVMEKSGSKYTLKECNIYE